MQIGQRGYIVNTLTGVVAGTWILSGGSFIGFPGEDTDLHDVLDDLNREGVPLVRDAETTEGRIYTVEFVRTPAASLLEVGDALAVLGYQLLSAEAVENGDATDAFDVSTESSTDNIDAWFERRGYILNSDHKPITIWYMIGNTVEIVPLGNHPFDDIVLQLKINGISTIERSYDSKEFARHSEKILEWAEASPIEIATELLKHDYSMLPAMEVESITKEDYWDRGDA